jgi:hypothetical protein
MYDPHNPYRYPPAHPEGWDRPLHRRRLNGRGVTVVLILFALLCAAILAVLKLGLVVWNSPLTPVAANSAARIGTAVADAAMEEVEIPYEVRRTVTEEADTMRREVLGDPGRGGQPRAGSNANATVREQVEQGRVPTLSDVYDVAAIARQMDQRAPPRVE